MQESLKNSFNDSLTDEILLIKPKGELVDKMIDEDTGESKIINQGHNMIMLECHKLIAGLVGGTEDATAPLYFAVGNSSKELNQGDDNLDGFLFKIPITNITIEGNGNILVVSAEFPGAMPSIATDKDGNVITDEKYNTTWTECAIFKGAYMLNRKIHGAIDKNQETALIRTFKFTF